VAKMDDDLYVTLEEKVYEEKGQDEETGDTGQQDVEETEEGRTAIALMLWGRWRRYRY